MAPDRPASPSDRRTAHRRSSPGRPSARFSRPDPRVPPLTDRAAPPPGRGRPSAAVERLIHSPSVRSGYASLVTHLVAFLLLGLTWESRPGGDAGRPILIRFEPPAAAPLPDGPPAASLEVRQPAAVDALDNPAPPEPIETVPSDVERTIADAIATEPSGSDGVLSDVLAAALASAAVAAEPPATSAAAGTGPGRTPAGGGARGSPYRVRGGVTGPAFGSRRGAARGDAVRARGGSPASEAAVEAGLAWLAAHQAPDGSWRCDLSGCGCNAACRDRGSAPGSVGATAIALLPFLGAGHTHQEGRWQQTVSAGLYFLLGSMRQTPRGGDLCEGSMYAHGIATLVFTEAFGLTRDELLRVASRDAIRFIETSQDPHGGGWRYLPGQPGDTTVTGWQIVALKSGALAGLEIPSPVTQAASRFLDRVQSRGGAAYGYLSPTPKSSTTAVGLLCRMVYGWKPGHEPLDDGIRLLLGRGHDPQAVYTNFYLSQILLQADHPAWPRWNAHNRDMLVRMQAQVGHERGSWTFLESETAPGGRLVHTALAVLMLEVYYRLLPIYGDGAFEGGF